jgi:hypothetical protein
MNGEFRRADVDFFFSTKKEFREGNGRNVNVWLQRRSLPARGRVGLEVHRCLCIIDAGIRLYFYESGAEPRLTDLHQGYLLGGRYGIA